MRVKAILCCVVALLLGASTTQAAVLYYTAHATPTGTTTSDIASYCSAVGAYGQSGGKLSAPGIVPTATYSGFYVSANVPVIGTRSFTYSIPLTTGGWYDLYTTFGATTSAKNNAKHVVTDSSGSATYFVDQTAAGGNMNKWVSLGTHAFNANSAATTKVVMTNDNQTTSGSLYVGALKFEASTPGAPTNSGPADGASGVAATGATLSWAAGSCSSFFDVFLEASASPITPTTLLGADLSASTLSIDTGALLPNTTYYWMVKAKNVDVSTSGAVWSFTTLPEPATLAFLGLSGLLLRRRRA